MEIGMETIDDRVTKGMFGEDEQRPARFGIGSRMSGEVRDGLGSGSAVRSYVGQVRDGSEWLGIGRDRVGRGRDVSVYNTEVRSPSIQLAHTLGPADIHQHLHPTDSHHPCHLHHCI